MAFQPRYFDQILDDMIAYVQVNTSISDFNVGSVARTMLEAAALEDDEQYYQMVQLLDAFRLATARGEDLDRRLADFGIARGGATSSTVRLRFFDTSLKTTRLSATAATLATSIQVFDSSVFPSSGYPYTIRIGEGTVRLQDLVVTNNDTTTSILTLSTALNNNMLVGDRVSLVTGASSRVISTSTNIQAPATVTSTAKIFKTQEPGYIIAGNFFSNEVLANAVTTGSVSNAGISRINQFPGSPPFSGAGVVNLTAASGGQDRENDADFRDRALRVLQSLSRGTPLALRTAAVGVIDPATGQRCVSANIIEDFTNDEVFVYIDDGTGLVPDSASLASGTINNGGLLPLGSTTITLTSTANFPSSGRLLIESDPTNDAELVEVVSKDDALNILTLASPTTANHDDAVTVFIVDIIGEATEAGRRRFKTRNFPVVRGTERIFIQSGTIVELQPDVDYRLNKGTGEFQLTNLSGIDGGATIFATYTYYTNLIKQVQLVLEGLQDNPTEFPGVKAAGIFLAVEAPAIKRVTVIASISAQDGFREQDLVSAVQAQIETYINSRNIGDNIIRSKIIDVAHNVPGLRDISISVPTSNITVLENELPVPFDADGDSLVTIL